MARAIPLTRDARQRLTVSLDGQLVTLTVWWQPLTVAWYVSVALAQTPVVSGRQIAPGQLLVNRPDAFVGDLVVVPDDAHVRRNLDREAWANDAFQLVYLTPAEVTA